MKTPAVSIVSNRKNGAPYVGVTSKQAGSRQDKIRLIEKDNVDWLDLHQDITCN